MSSEYDAGHGWKDKDEEEFEKALNLTHEEQKQMHEIDKLMGDAQNKFTFFMRQHQADPKKPKEIQFSMKIREATLAQFMWLRFMVIEPGWQTSAQVIGKIIQEGVKVVYGIEQEGVAAAFLAKKMLSQMPPEFARATLVNSIRAGIEQRKRVEEQGLKESMGEDTSG